MRPRSFDYKLDEILINNETKDRYKIQYKMVDNSSFCIEKLDNGERFYINQTQLNKLFTKEAGAYL